MATLSFEMTGASELMASLDALPRALELKVLQDMMLLGARSRAGITDDMRILFGTRTFDIKGHSDIEERHRRIDIACVERSAARNT